LESAKECVTTHLPNELALKMDGAAAYGLYTTAGYCKGETPASRRAWCLRRSPWREPGWSRALVQILVVVANIQVRTLKAEVGNGSM